MRKPCLVLGALLLVTTGCAKSPADSAKRAQLRVTGGTTFELVPNEGQFEHCLAYTVSRSGLTRQLTMSRKNESFHCPAGQRIGGHSFKVPLSEGPVRVYVLFTSHPVNAGSVSQQLLDAPDRQALTAMNLRLPGAAALEALDFVPEEDVAAVVGEPLEIDAGVAVDGGPPQP